MQTEQLDLTRWLDISLQIPGWTRGPEAEELAHRSFACPDDAVIVEIGTFLGSGAILLAGPRKQRGSGRVHCVDRLDAGGDAFSIPHYARILDEAGDRDVRRLLERTFRTAGLEDWVEIHQGDAAAVAASWTSGIDLLFLDGDQTRAGARAAFDAWSPFVVEGGVLALHNAHPDYENDGHDGHAVVARELPDEAWQEKSVVGSTTFARRTAAHPRGRSAR